MYFECNRCWLGGRSFVRLVGGLLHAYIVVFIWPDSHTWPDGDRPLDLAQKIPAVNYHWLHSHI